MPRGSWEVGARGTRRRNQRRSESQNAQWGSAANPVSCAGCGGTSDCMLSVAVANAANGGWRREPGWPVRAKVVQYEIIASDSFSWLASRPGAGTVIGSVNRYWISDACAAAYENDTGGRNRSGALGSLNSYANVGTNCDNFCSTKRALQSKMPSVPSADRAR